MSFYKHHVFVCTNQRGPDANRPCCANAGAEPLRLYAKKRLKALGKLGEGKIRINNSGCLDRCELGPVLVVYPEETWYTYFDESDIDEIIERHLFGGKVVERLLLPPSARHIANTSEEE